MAITCCSSCCCMAGGTAGLRRTDLKISGSETTSNSCLSRKKVDFTPAEVGSWGVHQQKIGIFLTNNNESGWKTSNKLGLKQQTVGIICTRSLQSSSAKVLDWHGRSCTSRNLPGLPVAYWTLPTASRQLCIFVVSKDLHNHQNTIVLQLALSKNRIPRFIPSLINTFPMHPMPLGIPYIPQLSPSRWSSHWFIPLVNPIEIPLFLWSTPHFIPKSSSWIAQGRSPINCPIRCIDFFGWFNRHDTPITHCTTNGSWTCCITSHYSHYIANYIFLKQSTRIISH